MTIIRTFTKCTAFVTAFFIAALVFLIPQPSGATCAAGDGLASLGLTPTSSVSTDGVASTKWSGLVPSWDGVPLSLDVTVAPDAACSLPLISINHGYGGYKPASTSATGVSSAYHWNNVWFASRGYAVMAFTARGSWDSCGKSSSADGTAAGLPATCTANGRHYWIQFDDTRYSLRDLQWLTGRLVDAGVADPTRIGVTGGSMGGGLSWLAAVANDRIVCGGVGWDPANGADPCASKTMGALVPWISPSGIPLRIAAAVPQYGFSSLLHVLLPNGRASDGAPGAPPPGMLRSPIGVPLKTWVENLSWSGAQNGFYQPATSSDVTSNWGVWFSDLAQQINTTTLNTTSGQRINAATAQWRDYKSAASWLLPIDAPVPILAIQGTTDGVITPVEAMMMWDKLKAFAPDYPVSIIFGDIGHQPATNPADLLAYANDRGNSFFDSTLRGVGSEPVFGVEAALTRCRPGSSSESLQIISATSPVALASHGVDFSSPGTRTTLNTGGGAESALLGQVGIAPCPTMATSFDPGVARWFWPTTDVTIAGQAQIRLTLHTTGSDVQLNTRLWNLTPGGTQTLITRGTFRLAVAPGTTDMTIAYEIPAAFYHVPSGDYIKLEVTGYDAPHFQADTIASTTTITSVVLHLPTV